MKKRTEAVSEGDAFILIHGTGANSAEWVSPDSAMGTGIRERFPKVTVEEFRWSGSNSHEGRISAGEALARRIDALASSMKRSAGVHLIGHSHGGNVALYARDRTAHQDRIKSIAFLGTPFLHMQIRAVAAEIKIWTVVTISLVSIILYAAWMLAVVIDEVASSVGTFIAEWIPFVAWEAPTKGNRNLGFLVITCLALALSMVVGTTNEWLKEQLSHRLTARSKRFLEAIGQSAPTQRTFIAVTRGDEARLWLRAGDRASSLPATLFSMVSLVAGTVGGTALLWNVVVSFLSDFIPLEVVREESHHYPDPPDPVGMATVIVYGVGIILGLPILIALGNFVFRGHALAFGWEHPLDALACRLRPLAVPEWASSARTTLYKTDAGAAKGLRHSAFYEDARTIAALLDWLDGKPPSDAEPLRIRAPDDVVPWYRRHITWTAAGLTSVYCLINVAMNMRLAQEEPKPGSGLTPAQAQPRDAVPPAVIKPFQGKMKFPDWTKSGSSPPKTSASTKKPVAVRDIRMGARKQGASDGKDEGR